MVMPSLYLSFPLSVLLLFPLIISCIHSFQDDRQSLLTFKSLITHNPNHSMADWSSEVPLCNWTAVTCTHRHPFDRVIALNLSAMDLQGTISPSLGNLSFLHSLDLSINALHGHIPPQLGRLFRLRTLKLNFNQLEGNIPTELGSLAHLQSLNLVGNRLTGAIPFSIANLSDLIVLGLGMNNVNGSIPPQLGLLNSLELLELSINELTGTIPASLSNISTLTILNIFYNKLSGIIPRELGLLANLQTLIIHDNELSGPIPTSLSNISTLSYLDMSTNNLRGTIPQELGRLTNLQTLALYQNELVGIIPSSLSNIFNLNALYLWENRLSGNIPNSIGNCSQLKILGLGHNMLSGNVPLELGNLSLLEKLDLESNQLDSGSTRTMPFLTALTNCSHLVRLNLNRNKLSGVLPPLISMFSANLSYMSLSNNLIEGSIPTQIGNLSNLIFLNLSGNLLNGSIPPLGNLEKIQTLDLGNNRLEGNIPDDFKQLKHLGVLDISGNMLSGKIPNSLRHLKQLWKLYLQHNYLSDKIPPSLGDCENLALLDLSHNRFNGSIPLEVTTLPSLYFYLNLSWNLLDGPLPLEIVKLENALAIDVSSNLLTGVIPPMIGNCVALESLNLSHNSLEGSIPDSLGDIQYLMELDLSNNSLSGTIPITLNKLKKLHQLILSFNNLEGEISKGEFPTNQSMIISLIGNPGLCGPQVFSLPACPTSRSHFEVLRKVLFPIVGGIGFILCCILLGFLSKRYLHKQKFDFPQVIFHKLEHGRISYEELSRATDGFSEANLLGKGSFGSVYKGILSDGMLIAVKVFHLQNEQVLKSFKVECKSLQKVRHRNIMRIIASCSNLHFKALVFNFMCNGSLEKHLYPNEDDNNDVCELGFKQRLGIAIDVAHAMEYLHHDSSMQTLHCDIKPSNVLLDENMIGHVTDFGIAKLIGATSSDSLTSTVSLKGSMGYIAPEYGLGERVSTKGDVYSYGILLLEMLTRKRPTSNMFAGELNLHKWVNLAFPNRVKEIIDSHILNEVDGDEIKESDTYKFLLSLVRVGLLCSKDSPEERPTMRDVSTMLESLRDELVGNDAASRRQSIAAMLSNSN